ncbi:MAG: GAF domain-containing protein [Desulfobacteraceae bacterium]|nr:MAG: GAF domain-containing protein [Desulfobacteraceae bacterium]
MSHYAMNYETLQRLIRSISMSKDPEEVALMTVEGIKSALGAKGCVLFLLNDKTHEFEIAAAYGLSREYLEKGPISALRSIAQSPEAGPVAIYDVGDDPRIQYPEAASKEGIVSILAVPIGIHGKLIGTLRVYTADHWEFTLNDINLVQALAQIAGMSIDMCRLLKGYKQSIEILKEMRDPKTIKPGKKTPHEGVPVNV